MPHAALAAMLLVLAAASGCSNSPSDAGIAGSVPEQRTANAIVFDDNPDSHFAGAPIATVVLSQRRTSLYGPYGLLPYDATMDLTFTNSAPVPYACNVYAGGLGWEWRGAVALAPGESITFPGITNAFYGLEQWTCRVGRVVYSGIPVGDG